ncbi:hypothetical protein BH10BAC5_BH10BAC5_14670 [soil metagenome]
MNLEKIIEIIETATFDPSIIKNENYSRREAIEKVKHVGIKTVLAAIPLGFAATFTKYAYAEKNNLSTEPTLVDVLNYLLTLEYLESKFYSMALQSSGLIPASDTAMFTQIANHQRGHILTLSNRIKLLSGTPIASPEFDFTAGGMYPDVFTNYQTFLAISQSFEDLGVRAYKGQFINSQLRGNADAITVAFRIHSVEARHAAQVRRLRGNKGWITNASAPGLQPEIYAGENNLIQSGINMSTVSSVNVDSLTEAFDEPLYMNQVLSIANAFIV